MAQIVSKLNLNKTPSLVESNSLIFAKNIRLDVDSTIHEDYGIKPLSLVKHESGEYYNDYEDILFRIKNDLRPKISANDETYYVTVIYKNLCYISNDLDYNLNFLETTDGQWEIVGHIEDNKSFYLFITGTYKIVDNFILQKTSCIIRYNEDTNKFEACNCNWNWSGGEISGCVTNNLVGDTIINIGEYADDKNIPIKFINLNKSSIKDDETLYTQTPNIPLINLNYKDSFVYSIPNGVYQFFIRYKIKDDFYTNWFPASKELFAYNTNEASTSYGSLKYSNIHRDSDRSFIFNVENILPKNNINYKSFQVGFILSHDDAIYARAWKEFDINTNEIKFDYNSKDAFEIEITDLSSVVYNLYNVKNIVNFKNKLYIANYKETDFNLNFKSYADEVDIEIIQVGTEPTYGQYGIQYAPITPSNRPLLEGLIINNNVKYISGENSIIKELIKTKYENSGYSIEEAVNLILNNYMDDIVISNSTLYGINCNVQNPQSLTDIIAYHTDYYHPGISQVFTDNPFPDEPDVQRTTTLTNNIDYKNYAIYSVTVDGTQVDLDKIISTLYNKQRYIDIISNDFVDVNGQLYTTSTIAITRKFDVHSEINVEYNSPSHESTTNSIILPLQYQQLITITFTSSNILNGNFGKNIENKSTLIPYQEYKFFIHYISKYGEITNGYPCCENKTFSIPYNSDANIVYPKFKNITLPKNYIGCFFSILHYKNKVATVFNQNVDPSNSKLESTCIDINSMLLPITKDITIKQGENTTDSGKYYYSNDSSSGRYFGADGVLVYDKTNFNIDAFSYLVLDYTANDIENTDLVKCTPFINANNSVKHDDNKNYFDYAEMSNMNLLGFICEVNVLDRQKCIKYYNDGSSVFYKETSGDNNINNPFIKLTELSKYNDEQDLEKRLSNFEIKITTSDFIYSNFNLNCLTLQEDPKLSIKTYYNRSANSTGTASEADLNNSNSIVLKLIPSQLMSDVYMLPSMYKDYTRKTYLLYKETSNKTEFNNTIRSSILQGDENTVYIQKFDANDYYNIPTNRDIIVNMISVGDSILVHTKDSMFRFSGSNTMQSNDGNIQLKENNIFETGVAEIFSSDFGFAGIQDKHDCITCELGYIFFDRDSRVIYMYSGQGQINKLSDSIEKLFRYSPITSVRFANDYYNNRFFVNMTLSKIITKTVQDPGLGKPIVISQIIPIPVTLSFNISENNKAFVSLHDFSFRDAFNTKTNCYFVNNSRNDICTIDKELKGSYIKLALNEDNLYPQNKQYKTIIVNRHGFTTEATIEFFDSIVDVIDNINYEIVKTLNSISWSGFKVKEEFKLQDENDITTTMIAEDINFEIPCKSIRIYTDSCMTPIIDCQYKSNNSSISELGSYKYPRYNQGKWSLNYFRNILNAKNHINPYSSDNNSLIEGKYFVVRFVFDTDFKLETLTINYDNKL